MRVQRERILGDAKHRFDAYYTATGRARFNGVVYRSFGWGSTPTKARLNLLHQQERRRFPVE